MRLKNSRWSLILTLSTTFYGAPLYGHQRPILVVGVGQAVKAPQRIERQIDGVELDVARGDPAGRCGKVRGHLRSGRARPRLF